jgi:hypothetical protein
VGESRPARRSSARRAARADLQRGRGREPDPAGRGRESRRGQEGRLGLPGLRGASPTAMVQALVLLVGQQPALQPLPLAHGRHGHYRAAARRTGPRRHPGRGLPMLARRLQELRTIPAV